MDQITRNDVKHNLIHHRNRPSARPVGPIASIVTVAAIDSTVAAADSPHRGELRAVTDQPTAD
ncbi:hypothetical protein FHT44_002826 [Mycolicibacterium sp. BK634]|uniref:hypothetical protein n=1 Tax=Mycobacteriaceae TaxID=1762 RepID=UPI00105D3EFE|nr:MULTISPECIES: hypothetical protein [Mycobacteriaceae]MBB3750365.1 hypothetical protein [Mycolicibacterium sp. BK634]